MTHLSEGAIVALRDGERAAEHDLAHLEACDACREAETAARARSAMVSDALALLDDPVDTASAKAHVRRRIDERRSSRSPLSWSRLPLGRAAAILLVTAGAASALPGSPVRDWWLGSSGEPAPLVEPATVTGAEPPAQTPRPTGIAVAVPDGRIAVVVRGTEPGTVVDVVWQGDATARISAPAGSGFTYGDGRAEVSATPGAIEVRLPRSATLATVEVEGALYLRRSAAGLEVLGPAVERGDDRIRFVTGTR